MLFIEHCDRTEGAFAGRRTTDRLGHCENVLLDLGGQTQHPHDLRNSGPGDALSAGDVGLIGGVAGFEEGLPLDGLAEELDHPGRLGLLGRLGLAPARWDGGDDPVGGHTARQGADVAVFEGPLGPQADLDRLFAGGGATGTPLWPSRATWTMRNQISGSAHPGRRRILLHSGTRRT